jgi:hypothetical protein
MPDPLSTAVRYRSNAAKFSELSKDAVNPFFRDYYERLSQRYLLHAENQERIAWISEALAFKPLQEPFRLRKRQHPPNLLRRHLCRPFRIQFVPLGGSGAAT